MTGPLLVPTVITGSDVEQAVTDTLKPRLNAYMDVKGVATPRAWLAESELDKFDEDQVPAIVVITNGTLDMPIKKGDGAYIAKWDVRVAAIVGANNTEATHDLARLYGAYIRAILVQEPSLHGFSFGCDWIDEIYTEATGQRRRTLTTVLVRFAVSVYNVVNARELPFLEDGSLPNPSGLEVLTTEVTVDYKE